MSVELAERGAHGLVAYGLATVWEGTPVPPLIDLPYPSPEEALRSQYLHCICTVEAVPAVPHPAALAVYGTALLAVALASYAAGRLARIRRKVRG